MLGGTSYGTPATTPRIVAVAPTSSRRTGTGIGGATTAGTGDGTSLTSAPGPVAVDATPSPTVVATAPLTGIGVVDAPSTSTGMAGRRSPAGATLLRSGTGPPARTLTT